MKRALVTVLVLTGALLSGFPLWAGGAQETARLSPETEAWLKTAALGKHAVDFNEAALYEAAKKEGEVVIYSYSSRVTAFGKTFEEKYPGIKVNGVDIDSAEIVTKVIAEQQAKNYNADVIFLKDPSSVVHELLDRGLAFAYVPSDLVPVVPEHFRDPLLVHHTSIDVLIYNDAKLSAPPIASYWDLTKPEWKGRFLMPDPQKLPEFVEVLATVVDHADEMAAEYQRVFGEKIKLSPGVQNAGFERILRVLNNDVVILGSTNDVAKAVGLSDQAKPPVGWTSYSRLRDKKSNPNLKFAVMFDTKPVVGVATEVVTAVVNQARHPNAAKLLIRWLMGDQKGGQGYAPYYVTGDYPARTDVPAPPDTKDLKGLPYWASNPRNVWDIGQQVLEFWTTHLK